MIDLAEEAVDLVVRIGEPPKTSGLIARRIALQELVVCAAPSYLQNAPRLAKISDLSQHAVLAQARGNGDVPWLFTGARDTLIRTSIRARHRFTALDTLAETAIAGFGVPQLPNWLVDDAVASGKLIRLLPKVRQPSLPVHALWLDRHAMPARLRVAIDTMKNESLNG